MVVQIPARSPESSWGGRGRGKEKKVISVEILIYLLIALHHTSKER